jgi:hypothetical protein
MKKIVVILMGLFLFVSCSDDTETTTENVNNSEYLEFEYGDYDVYRIQEIDGCEYIVVNGKTNEQPALTHKGNCKYCSQRNETKESSTEKNNEGEEL